MKKTRKDEGFGTKTNDCTERAKAQLAEIVGEQTVQVTGFVVKILSNFQTIHFETHKRTIDGIVGCPGFLELSL